MQVNTICVVQGTDKVKDYNKYKFYLEFVESTNELRYTGDMRTSYKPYWNIICEANEVKRV